MGAWIAYWVVGHGSVGVAVRVGCDNQASPGRLIGGSPARRLSIAVRIADLTWRRNRYRRDGADSQNALLAIGVLAQIAICLGGELLTRHFGLPFLINGPWLILIVAIALSVLTPRRA